MSDTVARLNAALEGDIVRSSVSRGASSNLRACWRRFRGDGPRDPGLAHRQQEDTP